jgi:AraC-like DNA-binding protein
MLAKDSIMHPLDRIVFQTATAQAGAFMCPSRDPRFRDSGPINHHVVVFPRTGVWIRHAGSRPFVADPHVITIYNQGQEYTRAPVSAEGDRCDWFGVSPEIAREIAAAYEPRAGDERHPFRHQCSPCPPELYLRQRALFHRLERGQVDELEAEESVIAIVTDAIGWAHGGGGGWPAPTAPVDGQLDLVERTRADIVAYARERTTLVDIARRLSVSPFHLCRVFRRATGMSVHGYRIELRQRLALEPLAGEGVSVSRVAADLGFASHSHLTATLRKRLGLTPTRLRRMLQGGPAGQVSRLGSLPKGGR